jgi:P27 family predicted phage terminase small subunit
MNKRKKTPPASLDAQGKRIWTKWIGTVTDLENLENLCIAYQTMLLATKCVMKEGILIEVTSERGYTQTKKNPACDVQATAQRTMLACSRKLNINTAGEDRDAFSEFE